MINNLKFLLLIIDPVPIKIMNVVVVCCLKDKSNSAPEDDDAEWEKCQSKLAKNKERALEGKSKVSHSVHCPYFPDVSSHQVQSLLPIKFKCSLYKNVTWIFSCHIDGSLVWFENETKSAREIPLFS